MGPGGVSQLQSHSSELKTALMLDASQESAWTAWTTALAPDHTAMQDTLRQFRQQAPSMTTPQRMEQMQAIGQLRQAHMERVRAATLQLYAQLRPDQQQRFDAATLALLPGAGRGPRS